MSSAAMKFVRDYTPVNPFNFLDLDKNTFVRDVAHTDSSRSYAAKERTRNRQAERRLKRSSFEPSKN